MSAVSAAKQDLFSSFRAAGLGGGGKTRSKRHSKLLDEEEDNNNKNNPTMTMMKKKNVIKVTSVTSRNATKKKAGAVSLRNSTSNGNKKGGSSSSVSGNKKDDEEQPVSQPVDLPTLSRLEAHREAKNMKLSQLKKTLQTHYGVDTTYCLEKSDLVNAYVDAVTSMAGGRTIEENNANNTGGDDDDDDTSFPDPDLLSIGSSDDPSVIYHGEYVGDDEHYAATKNNDNGHQEDFSLFPDYEYAVNEHMKKMQKKINPPTNNGRYVLRNTWLKALHYAEDEYSFMSCTIFCCVNLTRLHAMRDFVLVIL